PDEKKETCGQETVIVVEDNDMVREMTVEVLQDHGYNVYFADNGERCLELLQKHSGPLDLLLTDIIMPDMNGKDLFEQISRKFPQAKALYMSGYPENVISNHGILDRGVNFIQKPFSVQDLCLKVRELLDYK
ncbi:MAG: response regulator, partial [Thermodesulfobacteriota bacterium]